MIIQAEITQAAVLLKRINDILGGGWNVLVSNRVNGILITDGEIGRDENGNTVILSGNDPDGATQASIQAAVTGHNTLVLSATLSTITANGVQETSITSAGLTNFDYRVWRQGTIITSGSVNDGTLDFSTNEAGVYLIELISGSNTGYKEIVASG